MKPLLLLLLAMFLQNISLAQVHKSMILAVEPNVLLGNRTFTQDKPGDLYIASGNGAGIGVKVGFQAERKRLFANAILRAATVQNTIIIKFRESGFNDLSEIKYGTEKYRFGYGTAIGLSVAGGYQLPLSKESSLLFSVGGHYELYPVSPATNGVLINTGNTPVGDFKFVYQEEITTYSRGVGGVEFAASYAFRLKASRLFAGATFYYNPAQIKGNYRSFQGFPAQNSGTFTLNRSAAGLSIGAFFGGRSPGR